MQDDLKAGVIYADPNWLYDQFGAKKHGSPKTHYELAKAVAIGGVPVERYAKKDCILLLCATWPKLPQAFEVASAWGFNEYVTGIPWLKTTPKNPDVTKLLEGTGLADLSVRMLLIVLITLIRTGIGFWFQSGSEILLVFRRGKPPSPGGSELKKRSVPKGILCGSQGSFFAPVKEHSAKPLLVYDWARSSLKGPYLELFARNHIHGWTCWGKATGYWLDDKGVSELPPCLHCGKQLCYCCEDCAVNIILGKHTPECAHASKRKKKPKKEKPCPPPSQTPPSSKVPPIAPQPTQTPTRSTTTSRPRRPPPPPTKKRPPPPPPKR